MEGVFSPSICCSHKGGTGGPGTYWNDLLKTVKINGVAKNLEYDTIGNPTTYFNGTVWNFTWQNGRQMATAQNQAQTQTLSFTYGVDGIRTSKTVNGVTHHYINQNGKVIREYWTQNGSEYILDFFYDVNGKPLALYYRKNGTSTAYYYQTNLQGDVMKIFQVTSSGGVATATPVASYAYDAWGNVEAVVKASADNNDIANRNPLRYRGYYYDTETELYYLKSRYYDPALYRFVNADRLASTGTGFLGYNMFAYCENNPIMYTDPSGEIIISYKELNKAGSVADAISNKKKQVGCARMYHYVSGRSSRSGQSPNCLGYALGTDKMIDIYLPHSGIYKVDEIFGLLKNQMGPNSSNANLAALNYDVRRLDSIDEPIGADEFRIALRVGSRMHQTTGINLYHFMWQTANGQWASKYGDLNASELLPVGITPEDVVWKDGSYNYDSETLYLAVFPRE